MSGKASTEHSDTEKRHAVPKTTGARRAASASAPKASTAGEQKPGKGSRSTSASHKFHRKGKSSRGSKTASRQHGIKSAWRMLTERMSRWWSRLCRRLPRWALWGGGLGMAALYAWGIHRLFFAPEGIGWSAVAYPEGYEVHGIDVSHHQGKINWELLRNRGNINGQPLSFVFVKATEGASFLDPQFSTNYSKARQHGLLRGAYHFYSVSTPADQQARFFISHVDLAPGDLPPVLDVETVPASTDCATLRAGVLLWLQTVERHYGVKPILYTYSNYKRRFLNDSLINQYPQWIAHYHVDEPSMPKGAQWLFWQHSDRGTMPGIKEKVDLNVFRGSLDSLRSLTK